MTDPANSERQAGGASAAGAPTVVAVAGGSGFVGRAIVAELARRGMPVIALTRDPGRAAPRLPAGVQARQADATSPRTLAGSLDGAAALVIALAFTNSPMENPGKGRTFEAVDAAGTERLVAEAVRAGVRHVAYVSGAGAAPDAARHWFRAKWRAEEAVRGSGLAWTILRPTWIYGPGDVALNRFIGFARFLPFIPVIGDGKQPLAPVFIDDVARLVADALVEPAARNQVLEVGGPETMTMNDVIRRALRVAGKRRPLLHAPAGLMRLAARFARHLPGPPLTPDAVDFISQPATVDTGPLLALLPRRLTPLEEGLATYLAPEARTTAG
jgi:NADH dehydrogenase